MNILYIFAILFLIMLFTAIYSSNQEDKEKENAKKEKRVENYEKYLRNKAEVERKQREKERQERYLREKQELEKTQKETNENNTTKEIKINNKDFKKCEVTKTTNKNYINKNAINKNYTIINKEYYIQKGINYEYKIFLHYKNLDYTVIPHGRIYEKNDKGIDLIAFKENEIRLIQCKCYKYPPKQELLRIFMGDCELYIKNNKDDFQNKIIYKDFVTSCKTINYGVKKFLEEYPNEINYKII